MSARAPTIGSLTDRVRIDKKTMLIEPGGGHATVFVPQGTVWARVRRLGARMAVSEDARAAMVTHSVVLRFRSDVGPGDRIVYRGRRLEVTSTADLDGRRTYLGCTCTETEAAG